MILKIETYNGKFDNEIISLILSIQNDEAKRILVSNDEIRFAENGSLMNRIRYNKEWWNGTKLDGFDWNGTDGPERSKPVKRCKITAIRKTEYKDLMEKI